jgi:hypothetical protein
MHIDYYRVQNILPRFPIVSQMNPVHPHVLFLYDELSSFSVAWVVPFPRPCATLESMLGATLQKMLVTDEEVCLDS